MGYFSDLMIDMQERPADFKLAEHLGLTIHELDELVYDIEEDESSDGLLYNYRVEFDIKNSNPVILKKIKNLSDGVRIYLQPYELNEDHYYEEEFEAFSENENHLTKFNDEISNLSSLLTLKIENPELEKILNRQLFIGVIGTMETFLSEVFIKLTLENKEYLKNFISSHPKFKTNKFELREIFKEYEVIEETAKKVMLDTIYHNLPSVSLMFKSTFKIEFPSIGEVYKYVMLRHDLVHRNGMTKEGKPVPVNDIEIVNLIDEVSKFVKKIAEALELDK
ncbi:HEPN domain-containing protein [uncultured Tenacibaculum sp.]|uniref:HEPN domain-containing protein n=1 Tax=uncultured Tenacibaculum sp. TaxID=174713 RepID=UPI002624166E|nr:HEPN domain-containing protein [uncultured Tenacibaculum sp.]